MNLTTSYLGLKLRTPLVASASPLTLGIDNIKKMEDAGAAAVVFHSLFEEQMEVGGNVREVGFRVGHGYRVVSGGAATQWTGPHRRCGDGSQTVRRSITGARAVPSIARQSSSP